jgi:hypothetical protein
MNIEEVTEVWQAFSTLSDAQELIGVERGEKASDRINHAKRHLMAVLDKAEDEGILRRVVFEKKTCTLEEGGH